MKQRLHRKNRVSKECCPSHCSPDPLSMGPQKALETIGANLQKQYENWQPRVSVCCLLLSVLLPGHGSPSLSASGRRQSLAFRSLDPSATSQRPRALEREDCAVCLAVPRLPGCHTAIVCGAGAEPFA